MTERVGYAFRPGSAELGASLERAMQPTINKVTAQVMVAAAAGALVWMLLRRVRV
jgi:hypothetical protein